MEKTRNRIIAIVIVALIATSVIPFVCEARTLGIGDTAKIGQKLEITVFGYEKIDRFDYSSVAYGSYYVSEGGTVEAEPWEEFIIVELRIRNTWPESVSWGSFFLDYEGEWRGPENRQLSAFDRRADSLKRQRGDPFSSYDVLEKGETVTGKLIWSVPKDAKGLKLKYCGSMFSIGDPDAVWDLEKLSIPGFQVILTIGGLLAAIYLRMRERNKN
jgi:hypothetical protein